MAASESQRDPVVITGIGMLASLGNDRESVWEGVRQGRSGVQPLGGLLGIPDGMLIGAPVSIEPGKPRQLRVIAMCEQAADEAMADAGLADLEHSGVDRERFGCAISGHMGDTTYLESFHLHTPHPSSEDDSGVPWWHQWMPNTACSTVANRYQLLGPRICHSTACASGLIDILSAVRSITDNQCDIALAGSGEAFHPLFAAGFRKMRVLAEADDPSQASRPFDRHRTGFVMGEGAAMFVLERLSHALKRGARIYSEIISGKMHAEAHHVTSLEQDSEALAHLISETLHAGQLRPDQIGYVNAHATGTLQNDVVETRGIRKALGPAADGLCVSATKSMLGHLVNASGSVELALTTLALRDHFAPPTINLTDPDPECDLDCVPLHGRSTQLDHAMKLSIAFGGHLVAMTMRRWNETGSGREAVPLKVPKPRLAA